MTYYCDIVAIFHEKGDDNTLPINLWSESTKPTSVYSSLCGKCGDKIVNIELIS